MNNPKVLIVCEHASNAFGGEAVLPLNYFLLLSARLPHVFLLTHERTKKNLESIPGINHVGIYYIPDTWLHKLLNALSSKLPDRIASISSGALLHLVTQIYQLKMARQIVRKHAIDIIHEPAPVSPKQPSMMFSLGVPVIIGPMNGGMSFPPAFNYMTGRIERLMYGVIRALSSIYNVLIPGKLFSSLLLVANQRTKQALPLFKLGQVDELVENGVFTSIVRLKPKTANSSDSINVLYVGRLIDLKAIDIVIDAISVCHHPNLKLTVVGDGPERMKLEKLANTIAPGKVRFLGAIPHANIIDCYDSADIFVLASVRECGGAVVLEAMARGLPVIATNWGGPADYVTRDTGILIDPISREYMITEFAQNIDMLASRPELRMQYGEAALEHISKNFLWENKADIMIQLYKSILTSKNS